MTCILKFHPFSDRHFESEMESDELKVLAICPLIGRWDLVTVTCCQIGYDGCKSQPCLEGAYPRDPKLSKVCGCILGTS